MKNTAELKLASRLAHFTLWGLMLSPLLLLLDIVLLGVHIRLALGHWPISNLDSYGSPAFSWHSRGVIYFATFAAFGSLPFWLLALCFKQLRRRCAIHLALLVSFVLGWSALFGYLQWDPHGFIRWWLH
jgi:hypothetical protein